MNPPLAYLNGRLLPFHEAALPLHDAGFVSGATVVDNARTFRHKLFRWTDHLARFRRDCEACFVPLEATDEQLTAAAEELIAHNAKLLPPGGELQLVTFATPGPLGFYLAEEKNGPPTLGMTTYPLPFSRYRRFFTHGATLAVVGKYEPVSPGKSLLSPTIKHRSRMFWHVVDHQARSESGNPLALGMPLGPSLTFTETSVANYLAVIDGVVLSPPKETILAGISLQVVRELCGKLEIPFEERPIGLINVPNLAESMLCGTAFCLAPIQQPSARLPPPPQNYKCPGPIYQKLLAAWSDLVGVDIAKQFTESA